MQLYQNELELISGVIKDINHRLERLYDTIETSKLYSSLSELIEKLNHLIFQLLFIDNILLLIYFKFLPMSTEQFAYLATLSATLPRR